MRIKIIFCFFITIIFCLNYLNAIAETADGISLLKAPIHPKDQSSLQRGAKLYINYCSGCHSLNFMRYNPLGKDLGILDKNGNIDEQLVKDNLIFTGAKISDTIRIAMQKNDAKIWFGIAPPDLSLIARARGVDWLYTYLLSFYQDPLRPLGVNNLLFNETAMPDVLVLLRGVQIPVYREKTIPLGNTTQQIKVINHLVVTEPGIMSPQQFDSAVADIVNFLAYVAEPNKPKRESLGFWVIGFLIVFALLAYLLKKEYWRKIK